MKVVAPCRWRLAVMSGFVAPGMVTLGLAALMTLAGPDAAGAAGGPRGAGKRPPDILLLTVDTLRPDRLPFGGGAFDTAPFLDSLAARSLLAVNARSVSSWTLPAVATISTGLYPVSHGVTHGSVVNNRVLGQEALPPTHATLAEVMRRRGYHTVAVVANAHMTRGWGFERGFDRFVCVGFVPAGVVNDSLRALRDEIADRSRPLFLWVHYFDPHHPYAEQRPWLQQLHPEVTPGEVQFATSVMRNWNTLPNLARENMNTLMKAASALYDSEIRATDERIRALWREHPRLADCFLLFTADHGEEFREHGCTTHGRNLFDTTVRVPLFVRPPGGCRPDTLRALTSLVDVAPTLAAVAGARAPADWAGQPLWVAGAAATLPADRVVMAELDRDPAQALLKAWIGPRWKLVQDVGARKSGLYDLLADPAERNDRAGTEPAEVERALAALKRHIADLPRGPAPTPGRVKSLTPELIEQLKSLGYLQ